MQKETFSNAEDIINNIKNEPEVDFILILPCRNDWSSINSIKSEREKPKKFSIKLRKFDEFEINKNSFFKTLYVCEKCDRVIEKKRNFKKHLLRCKNGTNGPQFNCDQCHYVGTKSNLTKHKYIHNKKFSCETCSKKFVAQRELRDHQIVHKHGSAPEINIFCDKCEKFYPTRRGLQQHKKMTHNLQEVQCDYCDNMFKSKHHLSKHFEIHFKVPCLICGKCVTRRNSASHYRTHLPPKYQCDLCGLRIREKQNLKPHMRNNHVYG